MTPRRRKIVLSVAALLLTLLVIVVGGIVGLTKTDRGRALILRAVMPAARAAIPGQLYVGRLGGSLFTDITIDSLDIRTPDGTPFLSTGPIRVTYDLRDLFDFRVVVRTLEIERPRVTLVDYGNDDWNWKRALRRHEPRVGSGGGGRLGRYIVIDTSTLHELTFVARLPWELSDTLKGVKRDSALAYNLARMDNEIRAEDGRYVHVYRFVRGNVALGRSWLANPAEPGQTFALRRLDVVWNYPPLWFRNMSGAVRVLADTMWVDSVNFALPGSRAHGGARIEWGSDLPVRYDISLQLDTASFTDLAWIDPSIPHSGGGRAHLTMRNDPRDLSIIDYAIANMDASALRSRIRGDMTWGVGGPVVRLRNVRLDLSPAHTDLLLWMNARPFPYDWRGALTGSIAASGGFLNDFRLEQARLRFADEHVPGAVSSGSATGRLNILSPAEAVLLGVNLTIDTVDFRTPRYVNPLFAELDGFARGNVRLDSLWYDAIFTDADVELVDGPGQPSRFTGGGRYSLLPEGTWFDVDLQALPLSYTTLSRSYPNLPLRGSAVGRIAARGLADHFDVQTTLAGEGGELAFSGSADVFDPTLGASGSWRVRGANLQSLFGDGRLPATDLSMAGEVDLVGENLPTLRGSLHAVIDQFSRVADARVFGGTGSLSFDSGHVFIDTLTLESSALRVAGVGGLGLEASRRDSVHLNVLVDSLGGLRPWLAAGASDSLRSWLAPGDTLRGAAELTAVISGTLDSLDADGIAVDLRAEMSGLAIAGARARRVSLDGRVNDVLRSARGAVMVDVDSAFFAGMDVETASARSTLRVGLAEQFSVAVRTPSAARLTVSGGVARDADFTSVSLDTLSIRVDSGFAARPRGFALTTPAHLLFSPGGNGTLDSLVLQHTDSGRIALSLALNDSGDVAGSMRADDVPLGDFGRLMRTRSITHGYADLQLAIDGKRTAPHIAGTVNLRDAVVSRVRFGDFSAHAEYDSLRLVLDGALKLGGAPSLRLAASLPLDLALVAGRKRLLDDELSGQVVAERTDLGLLESLFPDVTRASGMLETDIKLTGTWARPRFRGRILVDDASLTLASLGVNLDQANADIVLAGDSVEIRRFGARSGVGSDSMGLSGLIGITEIANPSFDLRLAANDFLMIDKPRTASLTVSTPTPVTLTGNFEAPLIRGALRLDRGRIYINQLTQRRALDLNDSFDLIDTSRTGVSGLLSSAPDLVMRNLQLEDVSLDIGEDVWLRSPEANLKLGGQLRVTRSLSREARAPRLALADSLTVDRGTYQLNLGIARPGFEVERGVVRFFGDPDIEPALDITALHTVRETRSNSNRQDVRIRVNIGGTIDRPTLSLSSADNPPLPESDMLSYLVTGEPAYALLGTPYAEQGATLALRLAGSYLSSRLTGRAFDVVQIEPVALAPGEAANLRENGLDILASTRVGVGGQLARNTYVTFSTGLCGLAPQTGSSDALSLFAQGLGVKVERRFETGLSVALGVEPGSSAQACGRQGISRTFQQTPPQIGIDFFRYWTFK